MYAILSNLAPASGATNDTAVELVPRAGIPPTVLGWLVAACWAGASMSGLAQVAIQSTSGHL